MKEGNICTVSKKEKQYKESRPFYLNKSLFFSLPLFEIIVISLVNLSICRSACQVCLLFSSLACFFACFALFRLGLAGAATAAATAATAAQAGFAKFVGQNDHKDK